MTHYDVISINFYKLYIKHKCCKGRYVTLAALAVSKFRRNVESVLVTFAHKLKTLGPTLDQA